MASEVKSSLSEASTDEMLHALAVTAIQQQAHITILLALVSKLVAGSEGLLPLTVASFIDSGFPGECAKAEKLFKEAVAAYRQRSTGSANSDTPTTK